MQRKDLKKAIQEFSHKTNFYELGLVRKLLKYREKEEKKFIENIPKVNCPHCGSSKISIDDDGSEYSSREFLTCENCWDSFDDENGYIDAVKSYNYLCWGYDVDVELHFEEPEINKYEWKERCRYLILRELQSS